METDNVATASSEARTGVSQTEASETPHQRLDVTPWAVNALGPPIRRTAKQGRRSANC